MILATRRFGLEGSELISTRRKTARDIGPSSSFCAAAMHAGNVALESRRALVKKKNGYFTVVFVPHHCAQQSGLGVVAHVDFYEDQRSDGKGIELIAVSYAH